MRKKNHAHDLTRDNGNSREDGLNEGHLSSVGELFCVGLAALMR